MGKFWSGIARFFAVVFAIVFVLTTMVALLLVNIDRELLVSGTYKTVLARQQIYARMPRIIAEQLVMTMNYNPCTENPLMCENIVPKVRECAQSALGDQRYAVLATDVERPSDAEIKMLQDCVNKYMPGIQPSSGNSSKSAPALFKSISARDMETVIAVLLPPDLLKVQTENLFDQVFSYLNGGQDMISINLVNLKQRLASQTSFEAILKLIRSQPACSAQQLNHILVVAATGEGDLVMCRPPEAALKLATPTIQSQLKAAVAQIPDTKIIAPQKGQDQTDFGPLGNGPTGGFRFTHLLLRLSPDIPLFFLLLISFLAIRTPTGLLRWWGIPLFFAGLLSVALCISASFSFEQGWINLLAGRLPPTLSLGVVNALHDLVRSVMQTYLTDTIIIGALLALVGLGMWIGSGFIQKKIESVEPIPTTP